MECTEIKIDSNKLKNIINNNNITINVNINMVNSTTLEKPKIEKYIRENLFEVKDNKLIRDNTVIIYIKVEINKDEKFELENVLEKITEELILYPKDKIIDVIFF
jgi:hypothetical protein